MNSTIKLTTIIHLILLLFSSGILLAFFDYYSVLVAFSLTLAYIFLHLAFSLLYFKKRGSNEAGIIVVIAYFMMIFKIFFCIFISYGIMKLQSNISTLYSFLFMFVSVQCAGVIVFLVKQYGK